MESTTFEGVSDRYNGITVDSQEEPCEPNNFLNKLQGKCKGHLTQKCFLCFNVIFNILVTYFQFH